MHMSGIGAPRKHIREMLEKKTYTPHVPIGSISKNKSIIVEIYGEEEFKRLITEDDETSIENETPNLAGYVSIDNFDIDTLNKCEQTVQNICSDIVNEWEKRFITNPFMDSVYKAFGIVKERSEEELRKLLISIIENHPQKEGFTTEIVLPGFMLYNKFALNFKERTSNMSVEKIYPKFLRENEENTNIIQFKVL